MIPSLPSFPLLPCASLPSPTQIPKHTPHPLIIQNHRLQNPRPHMGNPRTRLHLRTLGLNRQSRRRSRHLQSHSTTTRHKFLPNHQILPPGLHCSRGLHRRSLRSRSRRLRQSQSGHASRRRWRVRRGRRHHRRS